MTMPMTSAEPDRFEAATAAYRRELLAHCYRMTGSAHDVEDLVQETYLRAWRAFARFEGRSTVRTWLYRIATNVCLTSLNSRQRRLLPSGLGPPSSDPYASAAPAPGDVAWLEPISDGLALDERADPAEVAAVRQTVRLALVAAAQILPPRQRAAFFLCDVLDWPGAEAAAVLGVSLAALKSGHEPAWSSRPWPTRSLPNLPTSVPAESSTATWPRSSSQTWPPSSACWPTTPSWR